MGIIDARTNEYMSESEHFADVYNYFMYDGEKVIKPEKLRELDTRELSMPYGEEDVTETIQKYRDVLKYMCAMYDDNAAYLLLGIENQTEQHYAMPVRNMLYDAAQYDKQVRGAASSHRQSDEIRYINSGEYLSGFYKDDKLLPVITLVIYWSADEWEAPMSLHEMFSVDDESVLQYVADYKLNLISPYNMTDEDFDKFSTSLSKALKFIKYSKDKESLQNMLSNDKVYERLDRETAELINDITGSDFEFEEEKEEENMCIAIDDMKKEAADTRAIEIAKALLELGKNTIEDISITTKLPLEVVKELAASQML